MQELRLVLAVDVGECDGVVLESFEEVVVLNFAAWHFKEQDEAEVGGALAADAASRTLVAVLVQLVHLDLFLDLNLTIGVSAKEFLKLVDFQLLTLILLSIVRIWIC